MHVLQLGVSHQRVPAPRTGHPAPEGPLGEPEIHRRLVRALGAISDEDLTGLREAAEQGLKTYAAAFAARMAERPHLLGLAAVVLYETLGPTLPDNGAPAAALWGAAQMCAATYPASVRAAGFAGDGTGLGNTLFEAVLREPRGLVFTVDEHEVNWEWIRRARPSGRLDLAIPELFDELAALSEEQEFADAEFPLILSAGERRSNTAQTLIRDPAWRKRDAHGALRIGPVDARSLGVQNGAWVEVVTRRGRCQTPIEITEMMRPGNISLPNGLGLAHGPGGTVTGVSPNELTSSARRDRLAGTPWHKHVPARIEPLGTGPGTEPNPDGRAAK